MCLTYRYVDDAGDLDAPDGVSYADWEAQNSVNIQVCLSCYGCAELRA
jgi:hypothetical protein